MSSIYYSSLSGMMAASFGLQNTSNNISNLQSPGFKRSDVFYSSLSHGNNPDHLSSGVGIGGKNTNFSAGNYLSTENETDLAVVGNGFFIIKLKQGELRYTRDGEFEFNSDGFLVDKHSGGLVQGYDAKGALVSIRKLGAKTNPGKATQSLHLKGEWIINERQKDPNVPDNPDPLQSKYEHVSFKTGSIFDAKGREHQITLEFEAPNTPGTGQTGRDNLTWNLISATCTDAEVTFEPQSIRFSDDSDGTCEEGYNKLLLKLNDSQSVTLNFGEYMSDKESSVRLFKKDTTTHINTSITVNQHDGYGIGRQTGFSFDDKGQISYHYDNGQSETGIHVALAMFDDLNHDLVQANDNLFRAKSTHNQHIGRPETRDFGTIQAKKLESSNVDSTIEFGNIVVLQRMFQACSQMMDIEKQLLEDLY